ncbi:MAG TPA: hypothetical protein VEB22_06975 [Phycisphaerales bacterium]|nr:hypothetical protein [Phycisphaerales bacterium]
MKRTRTAGLIAAALLLAAAGAAPPPAGNRPPAPFALAVRVPGAAPVPALEPMTAEEGRFEGRWTVDLAQLNAIIVKGGYVHSLNGILDIACGLLVDIRADRSALMLVGYPADAAFFPWKADGNRLVLEREE